MPPARRRRLVLRPSPASGRYFEPLVMLSLARAKLAFAASKLSFARHFPAREGARTVD